MKSKRKLIISIAVTLMLSTAIMGGEKLYGKEGFVRETIAYAASTSTTSSGLVYTENANNTITITGYTGSNTQVIIPSNINNKRVTAIGDNAFKEKKITKIAFPTTLKTIGKCAFYNASINEDLKIPSSVTCIDNYAFENLDVSRVFIGGSPNIYNSAFSGCQMKELSIDGIPEIGSFVFSSCKNLENIYINATSQSEWGRGVFDGCTKLEKINGNNIVIVPSGNITPYIDEKFQKFVEKNVISTSDSKEGIGFWNTYTMKYVEKVVAQEITDGMSDLEKAKALHDWICRKVTYDYNDTSATKNHVDYGVFYYNSTVCDGYARAYALLLQQANIKAYYVGNKDHAWNIVRLGDYYFHIDVCHEDESNGRDYHHFMLSDTHLKLKTCSHDSWKVEIPSNLYKNLETVTPKCAYSLGDVNKDGKVNSDDTLCIKNHISYLDTIPKKDYVLADMNSDGTIDINDAILLSQKYATITNQTTGTIYTKIGSTASVTVTATGNGLKYRWYERDEGNKGFKLSSITTNTYSVRMTEAISGRQVYCEIEDLYGNVVYTNSVTLRSQVAITKQPTNATAAIGSTVKTTVTATGNGLKYQWYYKNPGSSSFSKSSVTSATYSTTMSTSVNGRQVYCIVTDTYGRTVKSSTVTLSKS